MLRRPVKCLEEQLAPERFRDVVNRAEPAAAGGHARGKVVITL